MLERDRRRKEAEAAWREKQRELWCKEEELSPQTKEEINNVRTKLFWVYQTRDPKEFKVRFVSLLQKAIWTHRKIKEITSLKVRMIIFVYLFIVFTQYWSLEIDMDTLYHLYFIFIYWINAFSSSEIKAFYFQLLLCR